MFAVALRAMTVEVGTFVSVTFVVPIPLTFSLKQAVWLVPSVMSRRPKTRVLRTAPGSAPMNGPLNAPNTFTESGELPLLHA